MAIRGGYAKGDRSKETILDVAVELFGLNGYIGTSLRDVARRSGLTHSGLLHHFPNKVALFTAVIDRKDKQDHEQVTADPNTEGVSVEAFMGLAAENRDRPEMTRLFTMLAAESTNPEHPGNEYFVERYRWIQQIVGGMLKDSQDAGTMRSELDPDLIARIVVAVMDGIQLQWLLEQDRNEVTVDMPAIMAQVFKLLSIAPDSEASTDKRNQGAGDNDGAA